MKHFSKHLFLAVWVASSLFLHGCTADDIPENVMGVEQMVPVMKELEIAYAGVDQTIKDPKERAKKYEEMNSLVLKKSNVDKRQFYDSYKYYETKPELLDTILKLVVQDLNRDLMGM